MQTLWDYSERAATYDKRADYSEEAVASLLDSIACSPQTPVADIGAGTGKLTKLLAQHSLAVSAVEPNNNMRMLGEKNTRGMNISWSEGIGEDTKLKKQSFHSVFFGSSFNVTDQLKTLNEVKRILLPNGWFICMWNHRDLDDPIQKTIEKIIHEFIPDYNYGTRREEPSKVIELSGHFEPTQKIEKRFVVTMAQEDIIEAWQSHDTLYRQSGGKFDTIIDAISTSLTNPNYEVPYFTRIWFARLKT